MSVTHQTVPPQRMVVSNKTEPQLPDSIPGRPSHPGASAHNPPTPTLRARRLSALVGVPDTYQLYTPNALFFCHLEKVARNGSWVRKKKDGSA